MRLYFSLLIVLIFTSNMVSANEIEDLLKPYETDYSAFEMTEIGDMIVVWYQRMINNAIVEKDQVVYQFDKKTKMLRHNKTHWREDLPESIDVKISQYKAEAIAGGETQFSNLYIISPESDVFPLKPIPENPCWVVNTIEDGQINVIIIDAVTGNFLGYGIPPPGAAFSMSGPQYDHPCNNTWLLWYQNAGAWFNQIGYPCELNAWPTQAELIDQIQDNNVGMFYEIAHSGHSPSTYFLSGCVGDTAYEITYADSIASWITDYEKIPFAFIASCYGMCYTDEHTLSHAFRKGSHVNTATVGYCDMGEFYCFTCWSYSLAWQDSLFSYIARGQTVKQAYDQAMADYPICSYENGCMMFEGDETFAGPYIRGLPPDTNYQYMPGDANMALGLWPPQVIGSDLIYLARCILDVSEPCLIDSFYVAGDINGDCRVIGSDVTRLVNYFKGINDIRWCPDYIPDWLYDESIPEQMPPGWPGCED